MWSDLFLYENNLTVTGLTNSLIYEYVNNYYLNNDKSILVVADSLYEANNFYKGVQCINNDVCLFPMDEFATVLAISESPDLKLSRIEVLNKIKDKNIIVTNLSGYLKRINKSVVKFNIDNTIKRKDLLEFLDNNSYNKTNLVTSTGEYAVRNFIVDLYPVDSELPIRIEFFGEDVESIRYFSPDTQMSYKTIDSYEVYSFSDDGFSQKENLSNKLGDFLTVFIDYKKIINSYNKYLEDKKEYGLDSEYFSEFKDVFKDNIIYINTLDDEKIKSSVKNYKSSEIINFNNNYDNLVKFVNKYKKDKIVVFMVTNTCLIDKLISLFGNDLSFNTYIFDRVNVVKKNIQRGFEFDNYIVISEYDIENIQKKSLFINHYKMGRKIKGFDDLKKGDYVVHISHGIGQYQGLVTLDNNGIKKDYLLITYLGNDKIYVPAQKIETIYKYSDAEASVPKLNSLSNNNWLKTKEKVRKKIDDISQDLIKLYAEREIVVGEKYVETPEEVLFKNDFEYEETPDQTKSINDILNDLSNTKPMDRLLCGDVGFGKTEVAMRAMFRTVMNNRQVAYLCPTTLLSKQQYETAIKRFRHFPVNIELLNRFNTPKDVERILNGIKKGTVDIVIGTHKLLNDKIEYKNLGLLIIDEEQRFGVSQKEKIKQLRNSVNVLTLSATPIPRTLKLSMSGVKDMSIIDTPPINRYPVQTYVVEDNDYLLKEAIYKELSRDGQVYILINNIEKLDEELVKVKTLVPEANVAIAHGRMEKNKLDNIVTDFIDGNYNVLICTTIIETGIDIPNVNTLIIKNADRFGLSQLYQIRGRVGRSDKIAYAYMMYDKNKMLNDIAIKRLQTIRDFTELGSGYKIAMRDLSIRGAGELLGSTQSGFVSSVGIDLYMDMVNDEINRLKGKEVKEINDSDKTLLNVDTSISLDYVDDEAIRIEIHKLINEIDSKEKFDKVKNELEDRFGKLSDNIINYMYEEWFQSVAQDMGINNIKYIGNAVQIEFPESISENLDGEKLFLQIYSINNKFTLKYFNKKLIISLNILNRKNDYVKDLLDLLILVKTCIKGK